MPRVCNSLVACKVEKSSIHEGRERLRFDSDAHPRCALPCVDTLGPNPILSQTSRLVLVSLSPRFEAEKQFALTPPRSIRCQIHDRIPSRRQHAVVIAPSLNHGCGISAIVLGLEQSCSLARERSSACSSYDWLRQVCRYHAVPHSHRLVR